MPGREVTNPLETMMINKRMFVYRLLDGEVAASIVDDNGDLLDVKYFGKFTEEQYASLRQVIDKHAARYGSCRPPDDEGHPA